jgi:hypothetical protein
MSRLSLFHRRQRPAAAAAIEEPTSIPVRVLTIPATTADGERAALRLLAGGAAATANHAAPRMPVDLLSQALRDRRWTWASDVGWISPATGVPYLTVGEAFRVAIMAETAVNL